MRAGALLLTLAGMWAMSGVSLADTLDVPSNNTAGGPARGLTMAKVEAKYGAPNQRVAPVGQPPITRWEYADFVVYFEREYVIHSVAR